MKKFICLYIVITILCNCFICIVPAIAEETVIYEKKDMLSDNSLREIGFTDTTDNEDTFYEINNKGDNSECDDNKTKKNHLDNTSGLKTETISYNTSENGIQTKKSTRIFSLGKTGNSDYLSAYANLLKNKMSDIGNNSSLYQQTEIPKFQLVLINDDTIPELVYTPATVHASGSEIYTFLNNNLVSVGVFGSYGECYYSPQNNTILSEYVGGASDSLACGILSFSRMSETGEEISIKTFVNDNYSDGVKYKVDGQETTKSSYINQIKSCINSRDFKLIGFPMGADLTEKNINYMLKDERNLYGNDGHIFVFDDYLDENSNINIEAERCYDTYLEVVSYLHLFKTSSDESYKWFYTDDYLRKAVVYPDTLSNIDYTAEYYYDNNSGNLRYMIYNKSGKTSYIYINEFSDIVRTVIDGIQKEYPDGVDPYDLSDDIGHAVSNGLHEQALFHETKDALLDIDDSLDEYLLYKADLLSDKSETPWKTYTNNLMGNYDLCNGVFDDVNGFQNFLMTFYQNDFGWGYIKDPKSIAEYPLTCKDTYFGVILKILKEKIPKSDAIKQIESVNGGIKDIRSDEKLFQTLVTNYEDSDKLMTLLQNSGYSGSIKDFSKVTSKDLFADPTFKDFLKQNVKFKVKGKDAISVVKDITKVSETVADALQMIINMNYIYGVRDAYEPVIDEMLDNAKRMDNDSDKYFIAALNDIKICMDNPALFFCKYTGRTSSELAFDFFWGAVIDTAKESYPAAIIVYEIFDLSTTATELLTNKSEDIDTIYQCMVMAHIKSAAEYAYQHIISRYRGNRTIENARLLLSMYEFLKKSYYADIGVASSHVDSIKGLKYILNMSDIEEYQRNAELCKASIDNNFNCIDDYCDNSVKNNRPDLISIADKEYSYGITRNQRKYTFACPVDVYVHISTGDGSIVDNKMSSTSDVTMYVNDGKKTILVEDGTDATITVKGNGTGYMDCLFEKVNSDGEILNHYASYTNIPVSNGSEYHLDDHNILVSEEGNDLGAYLSDEPIQFTLNNSYTPDLEMDDNGVYSGFPNTEISVCAVIPKGYTLTGWDSDVNDVIADTSNVQNITITLPKSDFNLNAQLLQQKNTYTIKTSCSEGGYLSAIGDNEVVEGDSFGVYVYPGENYKIESVTIDGEKVENKGFYSFHDISSNHELYVAFSEKTQENPTPSGTTYTISAMAGSGGTISPSGYVKVESGKNKTFIIEPESGYKISDVMVDGTSIGAKANYTFKNVTENHSIEASFIAGSSTPSVTEYTIKASAGAGGTITPSGDIKVEKGKSQTFTIKANDGYSIGDVKVDSVSKGTKSSYTFSNVTANHSIVVSFIKDSTEGEKPADNDKTKEEEIVISLSENKPQLYSTETRGNYSFSYYHVIPFWGKSKLTPEYIGGITISSNSVSNNKVTKIKFNKKKKTIQIIGVEGLDKKTVRKIKKATRGKNGLPFDYLPYYVRQTDNVSCEVDKKGYPKIVKVMINNKLYKAKKNEMIYNVTSDTISFNGINLAGSYKPYYEHYRSEQ